MGADEVVCSDVSNYYDWNADGIINLIDFTVFSQGWLTDSTDPNWMDFYDFDLDNAIDLVDFQSFAEIWLWQACWRDNPMAMMRMGSSSGGESMMAIDSKVVAQPVLKTRKPIHPLSLTEQLDQIIEIVIWLETIWESDPELQKEIDKTEWKDFMNKVYKTQDDLFKKWEIQQKELYDHKALQ